MSSLINRLSLPGLGCLLALACASAPVSAALVQAAKGSYNLGTDSSAGTTTSPTTSCGTGGTDALVFTGSGGNNIGIHSYSCGLGFFEFGSRSSGENTYYVDGSASVIGTLSGVTEFGFTISPGQVGAFGSTAFSAMDMEYQEASLSIKLIIDTETLLDDLFHVKIGAGGAIEDATLTSSGTTFSVSNSLTSGIGFASFTVFGDSFFVSLDADLDVVHDISYVISSSAKGKITSTTSCRGIGMEGGGGEFERAAFVGEDGGEGPPGDGSYAAYCGAGAQSGDPFPPIARALPEPGSLALLGLALGGMVPALRQRRRSAMRAH